MKIRIKLEDIQKAGYPPSHRVWNAFRQAGTDELRQEVEVCAIFRPVVFGTTNALGMYTLETGGCILSTQAEEIDP